MVRGLILMQVTTRAPPIPGATACVGCSPILRMPGGGPSAITHAAAFGDLLLQASDEAIGDGGLEADR
jgi:hypothetical protein